MKAKLFLLLGGILLLAPCCNMFIPSVKGDGNVSTHTIDISNYDQIEVEAQAAVFNYTQQPEAASKLTITVDQNIYDLFEIKTEDDRLIIRPKDRKKEKNLRPTQFVITSNSPMLKKASIAGSEEFNVNGRLVSDGKIQFDLAGKSTINLKDSVLADKQEMNIAGKVTLNASALSVKSVNGSIAGNAKLNLAGKGETAYFSIAGMVKVSAFDLELSKISCDIAGKGTLETYAKDDIHASIAGICNIYYKGNPSCKIDKAGLGKIKKVD